MLYEEMSLITGLGDSGLLLPASAGIFGYLIYQRAHSVALAWALALGLCLGLTVATKLGFNACGAEVPMLGISSPSGHTSFSATFFGCCALIAAAGRPLWQRLSLFGGAGALVLLVALSRIMLGAHSWEEVVAGLMIGAVSVGLFVWLQTCTQVPTIRLRPVAVSFAVLLVLLNGHSLNAEPLIKRIAHKISATIDVCR